MTTIKRVAAFITALVGLFGLGGCSTVEVDKYRGQTPLVDVSASTALKTWEVTHKLAMHETEQQANKWYSRLLPVWQVLRFNSPVMWASVAVSNVAARTLQPAVIDIIAKRAIDLYSGRLGRGIITPSTVEPVTASGPLPPM